MKFDPMSMSFRIFLTLQYLLLLRVRYTSTVIDSNSEVTSPKPVIYIGTAPRFAPHKLSSQPVKGWKRSQFPTSLFVLKVDIILAFSFCSYSNILSDLIDKNQTIGNHDESKQRAYIAQ